MKKYIIYLFLISGFASCKQTYYYKMLSDDQGYIKLIYGERKNKLNADTLQTYPGSPIYTNAPKPVVKLKKDILTLCYYSSDMTGKEYLKIIKSEIKIIDNKITRKFICSSNIERPKANKCDCEKSLNKSDPFSLYSKLNEKAQIVTWDTIVNNLEFDFKYSPIDSMGTVIIKNLDSAFLLVGDEYFWDMSRNKEGGFTPTYNIGKSSYLEVQKTFVYLLESKQEKTYTFKLSNRVDKYPDTDIFAVRILTSTNKLNRSGNEEDKSKISTHVQPSIVNGNRLSVTTNIYYTTGIQYEFILRNDNKIKFYYESFF